MSLSCHFFFFFFSLTLFSRACLTTVFAIWFLGEQKGALALLGIVLVIGGSAAYTFVRKMEMDAKDAAATGSK